MPSRLHRIIAFAVEGRHVKLVFGCSVYRMNVLHVTVKPQVVYSRGVGRNLEKGGQMNKV